MQIKKQRDLSIDILRAIAMIGIIIAHCNPSFLWVQIRSFDVILLVFLSAVCAKGFDSDNFNYFDFIIKRAYRLIIPVWVFLCLYYVGTYCLYYLPPISELFASFSFLSDRYVWIIRILIILALCAPILYRITFNLRIGYTFIIFITALLVCELIFHTGIGKRLEILLMTIPYAIVYTLGLNIQRFNRNTILITASALLAIYGATILYFWFNNQPIPSLSQFKYPPRLFYCAYGLGITLLLWSFRKEVLKIIAILKIDGLLKYIGQNSYWLYLLHIPFVDLVGNNYDPFIRFVIIFTGSILCVIVKNYLISIIRINKVATIFKG